MTKNNEHEDEIYLRGIFISLTIDIEFFIDEILSYHFCNQTDKSLDLREFLLPEIMFNRKTQILKNLLSSHYQDIFEKNKNHLDLEKLRNTRNKFAHNKLAYFRDKTNKTDYNKISFKKILKRNIQQDTIELTKLENDFNFFKEQLKALNNIYNEISGETDTPISHSV